MKAKCIRWATGYSSEWPAMRQASCSMASSRIAGSSTQNTGRAIRKGPGGTDRGAPEIDHAKLSGGEI